jgi:hypothetical protein
MDRLDELNRMQQRAFELAQQRYRWSTRGEQLRQGIAEVQRQLVHAAADGLELPEPRVDLVVG